MLPLCISRPQTFIYHSNFLWDKVEKEQILLMEAFNEKIKISVNESSGDKMLKGVGALLPFSSKKFWLYWLLGVFVFWLWYQATVNVLYAGTLLAYSGFADFLIGSAIGLGMIFTLFACDTWIVIGFKWRRNKTYRIAIDFILSWFSPLITGSLFILVSFIAGKEPKIEWLDVYIINFMIFMIIEVLWFVANYQYTRRLFEKSRRLGIQLEYYSLRSQVNPHFLFNSLNILYSLSHIDVPRSQDFILSLSKMYRYIMTRREEFVIPLAEEIDFVNSYVEVLKVIYYDCFEVDISGLEGREDYSIVPFSLQLLIENVTKHNVIDSHHPMRLQIAINDDNITVSNNVSKKKSLPKCEQGVGIGLRYLKELYGVQGKEFKYFEDDNRFVAEVPFIDKVATS